MKTDLKIDHAVVWNTTEGEHEVELLAQFEGATRFDCAVAFVKMSGVKRIRKSVVDLLERGGKARFIVGLDFCQTDPEVLDLLARWQRKFGIEAYVAISPRAYCFHPKIYMFSHPTHAMVMVGSANLTAGGCGNNWECSVVVRQPLPSPIDNQLQKLIEDGDVVPITPPIIADYRKRHRIAAAFSALQRRELDRLSKGEGDGLGVLKRIVAYLRADPEHGLTQMSNWRAGNVREARTVMATIRTARPETPELLQPQLKRLRDCMSASLLQLFVPQIIRTPAKFLGLLDEVDRLLARDETPEAVYTKLRALASYISGLGPNWLTEILHASDPGRYAILNKASVAGMALAGIEFPTKPTRANITGVVYGRFCKAAASLVEKLELRNMSELDAVFGYAYFNEEPAADEAEEDPDLD